MHVRVILHYVIIKNNKRRRSKEKHRTTFININGYTLGWSSRTTILLFDEQQQFWSHSQTTKLCISIRNLLHYNNIMKKSRGQMWSPCGTPVIQYCIPRASSNFFQWDKYEPNHVNNGSPKPEIFKINISKYLYFSNKFKIFSWILWFVRSEDLDKFK